MGNTQEQAGNVAGNERISNMRERMHLGVDKWKWLTSVSFEQDQIKRAENASGVWERREESRETRTYNTRISTVNTTYCSETTGGDDDLNGRRRPLRPLEPCIGK